MDSLMTFPMGRAAQLRRVRYVDSFAGSSGGSGNGSGGGRGSDDDGDDDDEFDWSSVTKSVLTGNPMYAVDEALPDYHADKEGSPEISIDTIDTATGGKIEEYFNDNFKSVDQELRRNLESIDDGLKTKHSYKIGDKASQGIAVASLAISAIDTLCQLCGWPNPIDEFIRKPFFGDWDAMEKSEAQWRALSTNLNELSQTLSQYAAAARDGAWQGEAGDSFASCCDTFSGLFEAGVSPCEEVADGLDGLEQLAQNTLDLVLQTIDAVISIAMDVQELVAAGELAWTGVGAVVAAVKAVDLAQSIKSAVECMQKMVEAINQLADAVEAFVACVVSMNQMANQAAGIRAIAAA